MTVHDCPRAGSGKGRRTVRELPYESVDGPALAILASVPRASRSAESPEWHGAADFVVKADGSWSLRVRSLFHGNRWCAWLTVRAPVKVRPADGWTATHVRHARRHVRGSS